LHKGIKVAIAHNHFSIFSSILHQFRLNFSVSG
jgi:hypothetical protein